MNSLKDAKKILLIRFSSIGDIIITTPVIRCVKRQTGAEVHFLCYKKFKKVLSENPYIDRLISIDKLNFEVLKQLEMERYDYIVDLHKNLKTFIIKSYLSVSYISFDKLNLKKWILVNTGRNYMPQMHLIDRYFIALAKVNIMDDGKGMDYFYTTDKEKSAQLDALLPEKFVCLVLGATYYTKRIPLNKCSEIIENCSLPIVLLGGNDVVDIGKELQEIHPGIVNLTGVLPLHESAYCIDKASHVITGDTGLMHMAAALKKSIIMVWGGTSPEIGMYPYYGASHQDISVSLRVEGLICQPCSKIGKNRCPKGHFACMMKHDFKNLPLLTERN
jgi:ADP-heptose:LPS heptosyltransferase